MTEEAGRPPCAFDPALEMQRDVASIEVMVAVDEPQFAELPLKLAEAVNVDRGGAVEREGSRDHRSVFESGNLPMNSRRFGLRFVRAWWG